ncbi:MAG: type III secretion system inner membrane ring subunit SctD [Paludibacterium sp.]|uniref:type III secretion system inner membrane ring subunit SctD n=1 Tax=Paludibacterium sp. TaxID=1917523 RepID=UPI0025D923C1|nr:type III secretion system inner membrane ring subunit SctD [Paludibacterium sp.]MBV8047526.1 type III secretion system inner membrane ring subunit SctD [Paludibacterium sp.]MBV8649595.1 type III secretion system inner membrane ring subunit SctD [Paludibacterium sp.]
MADGFKIRLLNGPLAGRTLSLPSGAFTLGGEDADLALALEGGGVATLHVDEDGVCLMPGLPCWVDGRVVDAGRLPLGRFIDLAGLHAVLGQGETDLPVLSPVPRATARRGRWLLAALLIVLAGAAGLAWWWPAPAAPPPLRSWLPAAMRPFPELQMAWLPDGVLRLSGRCADSAEVADLRTQLERAGVHYQWLAQCDDEVRNGVLALLQSYGYADVTVTIGTGRQACIQGEVRNDARFAALTDALDRLPGLSGWQIVDLPGREFERLLARLRVASLLDGLSVRHGRQSWVLSGELGPAQSASLRALLDDMARQGALTLPARLVNAPSTAVARDYLPAEIAGVDGNLASPYLTLANGMRLLVGASVGQGMRIIAIHPGGVSLAGRDTLVFLPVHA